MPRTLSDVSTPASLSVSEDDVARDSSADAAEGREALAARAAVDLENASTQEIIRWAHEQFGDRLAITSSMADALLTHLVSEVVPGIDVLFLDTGYHFAETLGTRDAVAATRAANVRTILPLLTVGEQDARFGSRLYDRDPDACCAMRKVEPLNRALRDYDAWMSGVRRDETPQRANTPVVEVDYKRDMIKINPLATWTDEQVRTYMDEHGVLVNPLVSEGFSSMGCAPCTRAVAPDEDPRAGRWAGSSKTECGLHL